MIFFVILFVFFQNRVQIYNEIVYVVLSKVCKFYSFLYFLTQRRRQWIFTNNLGHNITVAPQKY